MCVMVYIAADRPLPEVPQEWQAPGSEMVHFHVMETDKRSEETLYARDYLTKPYLYYVCTYLGCGCDFQYTGKFSAEHRSCLAVQGLAEYLRAMVPAGPIEMLAYGHGSGEPKAGEYKIVTPAYFGGDDFGFNAGTELMLVVPEDSPSA